MTIQPPFKPADAIIGERSRTLYTIWKNLAGNRLAPKRKEITLGLVGNLSSWMWTADVVDKGADFRFSLAGDRLTQFLGIYRVGSLLSEIPSSPFFERARLLYTYCVEHKQPVAIGPVRSSYEGREHWETEFVVLPLSEDGKNVTGLMGVFDLWPVGTKTETC